MKIEIIKDKPRSVNIEVKKSELSELQHILTQHCANRCYHSYGDEYCDKCRSGHLRRIVEEAMDQT